MPAVAVLAKFGFLHNFEFGSRYRRGDLTEVTRENLQLIRQAARECLNQLSLRAEEAKQAQTLLRPSDASTLAAPEVLLRPAAPTADTTAPEELLRPSGGTLPVQESALRSE